MSAPHTCLATIAAVIAVAMVLLPKPALAQTDWLKKGQEMLGTATKGSAATSNTSQVAAGLKEALRVGSETVVAKLGQADTSQPRRASRKTHHRGGEDRY
jgi:hypothetical protein